MCLIALFCLEISIQLATSSHHRKRRTKKKKKSQKFRPWSIPDEEFSLLLPWRLHWISSLWWCLPRCWGPVWSIIIFLFRNHFLNHSAEPIWWFALLICFITDQAASEQGEMHCWRGIDDGSNDIWYPSFDRFGLKSSRADIYSLMDIEKIRENTKALIYLVQTHDLCGACPAHDMVVSMAPTSSVVNANDGVHQNPLITNSPRPLQPFQPTHRAQFSWLSLTTIGQGCFTLHAQELPRTGPCEGSLNK